MTLLLAFLIGFLAGLRSLTAPAATAWGAYLGWLKLERPLSLIGSLPSVIIFTLLAIVELVMDKLPTTPRRTAPLGLISRIVMGALSGACIAAAGGQAALAGAILGAIGGIVGAFAGYQFRIRLVRTLGTKDINLALFEDLVAIGGSFLVASMV